MRAVCAWGLSIGIVCLLAGSAVAQNLQALEQEVTQLVSNVSESIVSIGAFAERPSAMARGGAKPMSRSVGCGVVFDRGGLILTSASVVGFAREVEVASRGGLSLKGVVVGLDPATDLAVVRVDGADLRPAVFAGERTLAPGSWVFVVGNAFGSLPSVSMGLVSGAAAPVQDEMGEDMLRLSVPVNPGDTGAPVVDTRGDVVGVIIGRISINPWGYSPRAGRWPEAVPSSMGVAIPAGRALAIAREIVATGGKERGFLGVRVAELTDDLRHDLGKPHLTGVVVTEVVPTSPAESVGIAPGDVITTFGTKPVQSVQGLLKEVGSTKPGDLVTVAYLRGSKDVTSRLRVTRFMSEYMRQQTSSPSGGSGDADARIEEIKSEIERLRANLQELEKKR
jgi:S1-C subfamily serine protease